jgi:hypothetical protein
MQSIMIGNCRLELIREMSRVTVRVNGPNKVQEFVWKSGEDPKWLIALPVEGDQVKHVTTTRITWLLGAILKMDIGARGTAEKIYNRGDVKDFFFSYLEERTKAEGFSDEWPWNLSIEDVERIKQDVEAIENQEDAKDPVTQEYLEFLRGVIPADDMPYWDADLRENGSMIQREVAFTKWRKEKLNYLDLKAN